jgi:BirA family biotin operon repressor/biotin-[acetyl-CoA-carboxylase] ligase
VAGVLGELSDGVVILGIGVNVNQTRSQLPADTRQPVASLRTTDGIERDRAPILAGLLAELERQYERWLDGGVDALYIDIGARDFLRGRRVTVHGATGIAVGIDREGRLELDIAGERRRVDSGEVSYER